MAELQQYKRQKDLAAQLHQEVQLAEKGRWRLHWLGQAGYAITIDGQCLIVDPYLSDTLAVKYRGGEFPHARMMPIPIDPGCLNEVSCVLCSHSHTDHMDPGTLPHIAEASPDAKFIVPTASVDTASIRGVPASRMISVNAGDTLQLEGNLELTVVAAAHDELKEDAMGNHYFLGFILSDGKTRIYHSGDCVNYEGLAETLSAYKIDLALLPVNGRDPHLTQNGIMGNFSFEEAADLCRKCRIPYMIPHHFGMFAENTIDEKELEDKISALADGLICIKPQTGQVLELFPEETTGDSHE